MESRHLLWGVLMIAAAAVLVWMILTKPVHAPTVPVAAPTTTAATSTPAPRPLHERVEVSEPAAGATVGRSFAIAGKAPGNWYFEASFPIQVRDADNNKIGQAVAQAQGDWMTTEQVPFTAHITLDTAYTGAATLVLLRDNPSGLPENDDALEVPIVIQ